MLLRVIILIRYLRFDREENVRAGHDPTRLFPRWYIPGRRESVPAVAPMVHNIDGVSSSMPEDGCVSVVRAKRASYVVCLPAGCLDSLLFTCLLSPKQTTNITSISPGVVPHLHRTLQICLRCICCCRIALIIPTRHGFVIERHISQGFRESLDDQSAAWEVFG